ncbi:hypothetical protein SAMN02745119_00634 [Trichlorobacter thiogenes]|uniref:NADAR domain-containing protein n=1 Tax=Trichlorobacter thiogenes TaxID=115783 RepID=A0A1T4KPL1_9BACT|nr:NADAR family protein [Trichlorobacter thiogenes]SJZ44355.1 hypothetical protein SAMN02745119_00634 [Trichlorobacter thiogenes]
MNKKNCTEMNTCLNDTSDAKSLVVEPEISFYRSNEKPYGVFSNLYKRTIIFEGREYLTSEHAYQAGKARKEEVKEWILSAPSPALVAMAAHGLYSWDIVSDWSAIKFDRMRQVLRVKFTQHEDLRELLLSTGESRLVEAGKTDNPVNRLWGEVNGKGKNMLGVLLMELREELRREGQSKKLIPFKRAKSVQKRTPEFVEYKSESVFNVSAR